MKETMRFKGLANTTEGVSAQTGNAWRKTIAIFETLGDQPNTVAVTCFNSMCSRAEELVKEGVYEVNANVTSREYNGKWYTDVKALAILDPKQWDKPAEPIQHPNTRPISVQTSIDPFPPVGTDADDLPF